MVCAPKVVTEGLAPAHKRVDPGRQKTLATKKPRSNLREMDDMDNLITLGSLFAFMLIPLWIPLLAIVGGKVADLVAPRGKDPLAVRLEALKTRTSESRPITSRSTLEATR